MTQANFADLDLLLADNFIRAAEANGIEHVVYLGGLMPSGDDRISEHLASRREVEKVLRSRSIPVTALRAGLIFGPGGSSTRMLINLIRRLPLMILPGWTRSTTQTIDITDVVRAFDTVLREPAFRGGTYDLACHPAMTYEQLIRQTAAALGRRPLALRFPANAFALSRLWVAVFGGVPMELVTPLLASLEHDLRARPNALLDRLGPDSRPLAESVQSAVGPEGAPLDNPRREIRVADRKKVKSDRRVRSVQRLPLPDGWRAPEVAEEYGAWLTRSFFTVIRVDRNETGVLRFRFTPLNLSLLELTPTPYTRSNDRRRAYYISGGLLVRKHAEPQGRFEFRVFPENQCVIGAIHGFPPSLNWFIYSFTQAKVHLLVMWAFGRHLERLKRRGPGKNSTRTGSGSSSLDPSPETTPG